MNFYRPFLIAVCMLAPLFSAQAANRVEIEYVHSDLTNNFGVWNDVNLRTYLIGEKDGVESDNQFMIETDYKNHFEEAAFLLGLNYRRIYMPELYQDFSASFSTNGSILPGWLLFTELHRKFLPDQTLIAGLGVGYISNTAPYTNAYGLAELTYYLPAFVALQAGVRFNRSSPGDVDTFRYFGLIQFIYEQTIDAFIKYETGQEGYQVVGTGAFKNEFTSTIEAAQIRYWFNRQWGAFANVEYYQSPFYNRQSWGGGLLVQF